MGTPHNALGRQAVIPLLTTFAVVLSSCGNPSTLAGSDSAESRPSRPPAVVGTIDVGSTLSDIAIDQADHILYVSHFNDGHNERDKVPGTVFVIDTSSRSVTRTIDIGGRPGSIALDGDIHTLYVVDRNDNTLRVVDTRSGTVKTEIRLDSPERVAVNSVTHTVYVSHYNGAIDVIDGKTNTKTTSINVGEQAVSMAVDAENSRLYVSKFDDGGFTYQGSVAIVDTSNNTVVTTVKANGLADDVTIDPRTQDVYIASSSDRSVSTIAGNSTNITATVKFDSNPDYVLVDPSARLIYVPLKNTVAVIDGRNNSVTATLEVGFKPTEMALDASTGTVYVLNAGDEHRNVIGTISIIAPTP